MLGFNISASVENAMWINMFYVFHTVFRELLTTERITDILNNRNYKSWLVGNLNTSHTHTHKKSKYSLSNNWNPVLQQKRKAKFIASLLASFLDSPPSCHLHIYSRLERVPTRPDPSPTRQTTFFRPSAAFASSTWVQHRLLQRRDALSLEKTRARFSVCCHLSSPAKRDQQSSAHKSIFS